MGVFSKIGTSGISTALYEVKKIVIICFTWRERERGREKKGVKGEESKEKLRAKEKRRVLGYW